MPRIATDPLRAIVEDFRKEIQLRKVPGPKPATHVINFRDEKRDNVERQVYLVPIGLLRYRADNGRIASDVMNYQRENGPLDERDSEAQSVLERFLFDKDPERTEILMKSIAHTGQSTPAIITCDGFLIDGNRRKMVLERLNREQKGKIEHETMKVVVLPGPDDPGGPPSLLEIEKLENRYQLQSEGKAEYYGFDRALSIKRKQSHGFSLEDQIRDDPLYATAPDREITQAVKEMENEFLLPLECVDRYLQQFGRPGLYGTVSSGPGDKEGRWQAFIDYSHSQQRCFQKQKWLLDSGVEEDDMGAIENAAFKMIRLRHLKELGKIHNVMRQLPKYVALKDSRKEIIKISTEVPEQLPQKERFDDKGEPLSIPQNDRKWSEQAQNGILHHLKKAMDYQSSHQEKETPIELLDAALRKLNHDEMQVTSIRIDDFHKARQLASDIQKRAKEIEKEIYEYEKDRDSLATKR
jgi:hypothetical protein